MKWVFAFLVLANLGLWMWATGYHREPPEEAPPPRPALAPEKMRLLSEPGVKLKPRAPKPPPPPAVATCFRLGPFAEGQAEALAAARLAELKLAFERRAEETQAAGGFRVYLPPFPSKGAAEKKRKDLTRLGFKDHALMQEEGLRNAIALGLFSVEANAQAHVQRLAAKGVKAKMEPIPPARPPHWFELRPAEGLADILKQQDWGAGVEVRSISCPPPAAAAPETNAASAPSP